MPYSLFTSEMQLRSERQDARLQRLRWRVERRPLQRPDREDRVGVERVEQVGLHLPVAAARHLEAFREAEIELIPPLEIEAPRRVQVDGLRRLPRRQERRRHL